MCYNRGDHVLYLLVDWCVVCLQLASLAPRFGLDSVGEGKVNRSVPALSRVENDLVLDLSRLEAEELLVAVDLHVANRGRLRGPGVPQLQGEQRHCQLSKLISRLVSRPDCTHDGVLEPTLDELDRTRVSLEIGDQLVGSLEVDAIDLAAGAINVDQVTVLDALLVTGSLVTDVKSLEGADLHLGGEDLIRDAEVGVQERLEPERLGGVVGRGDSEAALERARGQVDRVSQVERRREEGRGRGRG